MKLLLFFPIILSAYFYPLNFRFQFMQSCMANSPLKDKYQYCSCVYKKLEENIPYYELSYPTNQQTILLFIKKASLSCLKP